MVTYNTGNPLGSKDPRDLYDNAETLDGLVNSLERAVPDRFGRARLTIHAVETAVPDGILARNEAEGFAEQAEAALSAIVVSAKIYGSQAEAQADTTLANGSVYVLAIMDDGQAAYQFYRKVSSSASTPVSNVFPSLGAIQEALQINEIVQQPDTATMAGFVVAIADSAGRIAFGIKPDGTIFVASVDATEMVFQTFGTQNVKGKEEAAGQAFALTDEAGYVGLSVSLDGVFQAPRAETLSHSIKKLFVNGTISGIPAVARFAWDYFHIISYGQSLALSARAIPLASPQTRFDSLMFSGGPIPEGYSSPTPYAAFVPLRETDVSAGFDFARINIDQPGETPLSGAAEAIKELIQSENGIRFQEQHFRIIGSAAGRGGTSILELQRGSDAFNRMIAQVIAAKALALAQGRSYGVGAVMIAQGEQDADLAYQLYYNGMKLAIEQANTDIKAASGQTEDVQFFLYQTAETLPGKFMAPVVQLQLAEDMANVHIATPIYQLPTTGAPFNDLVHLSGPSSKIMGAAFGTAIKRVCIDGAQSPALRPIAFSVVGPAAYVTVSVGNTGVMVDGLNQNAKFGGLQPARGFRLYNASGVAVAINSVDFPQRDRIRIVAAANIGAGFRLTYGEGGGNIRDNDGSLWVFDGGGMNHPMHNWLCSFSHTF